METNTMWVPKDERRLLRYYYLKADGPGAFDVDLPKLQTALNMDKEQTMNVLKSVRKRGLITRYHRNQNTGVMEMDLTQEAINLGQKYNSWWSRSNLWFTECIKNHWIWIIISFIIGVLATLLVQCLSKVIE